MFRLHASDATGQKAVDVLDVPLDSSVGELVNGVIPRLGLPRTNRDGTRLSYQARLHREARHVHNAERVGDAFKPEDAFGVFPNIDAGAGR